MSARFGTLRADNRFVRWWYRNPDAAVPLRWSGPLRRAESERLVVGHYGTRIYKLTELGKSVFESIHTECTYEKVNQR